jgi:L-threonylcarbamoyladenylate synthase
MDIIKKEDKNIIEKAVKVLEQDGLLIFPTETCYGAGVDATNQSAVNKLYKYKKQRKDKPFSVAVNNIEMAERYIEMNALSEKLYKKYTPGPITIISKSKKKLAPRLESEKQTLGLRIPKDDLILKIIEKFDKAITATSANISDQPNPYSIEQLVQENPRDSLELISLIIDSGKLKKTKTSTIVDVSDGSLKIVRAGKINIKLSDLS